MPNGFFTPPRISSRVRSLVIFGADAAIAVLALLAALLLRFDFRIPTRYFEHLGLVAAGLVFCRLLSSRLFALHLWSFRYSGLADGARVGISVLFGSGLFALGLMLIRVDQQLLPRSVIVIELLLSGLAMTFVRFAPRLAWMYHLDLERSRRRGLVRTLIVGAGAAGEMLLRDLRRSAEHLYQVVGFVDDNEGKLGHRVGGKPVLGGVVDLARLADRHAIGQILIAVPRLPAERVREILNLCSSLQLEFKILPVSYLYFQDQPPASMLQELSPQDLLQRAEVSFRHDELASSLGERCQLVAGAAGSIGSEVCRQLLEVGHQRLVMVDIDENGLYLLKRRCERLFPGREVVAAVGDVRDETRMAALFARHRPMDVFFAAARKHVPLMEGAPCEAVKTNVLGAWNVARAAESYAAERFVYMSTDKAVRPTSVMGATKRLGEMLVRHLGETGTTRFSVVRFGNVLDSAGSVVQLFREQITAGGPVTVTHPEARRFFMTISEAVGLVLRAAYGDYGALCVLEMGEPLRILDLARHMITMSGRVPDVDVKVEIIGLRPGEKLSEELLAAGETVMHQVDRRIRIVESPEPPAGLLDELAALDRAARDEDDAAVLERLFALVPDYAEVPVVDGGADVVRPGSPVM